MSELKKIAALLDVDISSLATFIAKTKLTVLSRKDIELIKQWSFETIAALNCKIIIERPTDWIDHGYQRNFNDSTTWPIRKLIESFLFQIQSNNFSTRIDNFLRCALLKTSQWALDNKKIIPSAKDFRLKLMENILQMCNGALEYSLAFKQADKTIKTICINKPSYQIEKENKIKKLASPKLILTSPPYPGVHVVYHRWQIHGRKETPAPFWIANSLDGHGLTHYAMGSRHQKDLKDYFSNILMTFKSIKNVCNTDTIIVQMLAFADASWQFPKYLETMNLAGFQEIEVNKERLWRDVPNRKWYANKKGKIQSSKEVVFFHKLIS